MKHLVFIAAGLCLWLSAIVPHEALGSGELIPGDDHGCYGDEPKNANFTSTRFTYVFTGSCQLAHTRLNFDVSVPWTGVGTYDPPIGQAKEDIIVPAPRIDQPSRPYGRFLAVMHCSADPWLNPYVKCDHILPTVDAPLDHTGPNAKGWRQPYPLAPFITGAIQQTGRPYTSSMSQDAVNKLNRLYGAYQVQHQSETPLSKFKVAPGILRRGIEEEQPERLSPAPAAPESGTNP